MDGVVRWYNKQTNKDFYCTDAEITQAKTPVSSKPMNIRTMGGPLVQNTEQMDTYTISSGFNEHRSIQIGDQRFMFSCYNESYFFGIYRRVGMYGKVQREKKFLFWSYWGESFADEIIVGVENMDMETDYLFPTPQQYAGLTRPSFSGIFNVKIGNYATQALGIDFNVQAGGINFGVDNLNHFVNSQFNSFLNGQFTNYFNKIVDNVVTNNFDSGFKQRYADYTAMINSLNAGHYFKIAIGNSVKPQGYSNKNEWNFDWNVAIGQSTYKYTMKAGSFYGKARFGGTWLKMRFVVQ
jgi:hypothetical protein